MTDDASFRIPQMMEDAVQKGSWKGTFAFRTRGETQIKARGMLYPLVQFTELRIGICAYFTGRAHPSGHCRSLRSSCSARPDA